MDNIDLKTEAPFVKMSVNVILTGAISKASGGDFYQGAIRALVVYLYNDMYDELMLKGKGVPAAMGGDADKYGQVPLEFSDEFIAKTNKKIGNHITLLKSDKHNLTVLNTKVGILEGSIGKANFLMPKLDLKKKEFNVGLGWNTFEGKIGGEIHLFGYRVRMGVKGFMGGLSGNIAIKGIKHVDIYGSALIGGGFYWDVVE